MREFKEVITAPTMNQVVDNALRELEELGLEEITPIPELSEDLGIGKDDFTWLDDILRIEN